MLKWPGNSLDLSPIENLWAFLKQRFRKFGIRTKPAGIRWFLNAAHCSEDARQVCENLIDSMPKRIQMCIDAKGGHINFWNASSLQNNYIKACRMTSVVFSRQKFIVPLIFLQHCRCDLGSFDTVLYTKQFAVNNTLNDFHGHNLFLDFTQNGIKTNLRWGQIPDAKLSVLNWLFGAESCGVSVKFWELSHVDRTPNFNHQESGVFSEYTFSYELMFCTI